MELETQFKIKNNMYYQRYIRENSYWYKILNRNPEAFRNFEEEVKTAYKLRPTDKISRALDAFELLQSVISTLK